MRSKNLNFMSRDPSSAHSSADIALQNVAQYIEDYIDLVENVPNEIVRKISSLHEHNRELYIQVERLEHLMATLVAHEKMSGMKKKLLETKIHNSLAEIQTMSDDKLFLVQTICDQLDNKSRQLDADYRSIADAEGGLVTPKKVEVVTPFEAPALVVPATRVEVSAVTNGNSNNNVRSNGSQEHASTANSSALRRTRTEPAVVSEVVKATVTEVTVKPTSGPNGHSNSTAKSPAKAKSLKRSSGKNQTKDSKKSRKGNDSPTALYEENPADPDEPTYCLCSQISFGEMIGCDNNNCKIEWFHFKCVQLVTKPKGKWYCPQCRGDKPNVPRK
ncbi:Inhibitor of growth protein 1 [Halotydeus destructor]|nr:Inhibitor of growth protein 1 [Halotydeus destructor]